MFQHTLWPQHFLGLCGVFGSWWSGCGFPQVKGPFPRAEPQHPPILLLWFNMESISKSFTSPIYSIVSLWHFGQIWCSPFNVIQLKPHSLQTYSKLNANNKNNVSDDTCSCPNCGYSEAKIMGVPCRTKICPKCGSSLQRRLCNKEII